MSRWSADSTVVWLRPGKAEAIEAALERAFGDFESKPAGRLTCVVAGDGVRYRVVPWSDELSNPLQRQVLAEDCFKEAYGEVSRSWTVRHDPGRYGAGSLACAIDTKLLDQLAAFSHGRRLRLNSVQPALTHSFNQRRRHIDKPMYWFVCMEWSHTTALLMSSGEPLLVRSWAQGHPELDVLLDRECFVLGIEAPRCPVYLVSTGSSPNVAPEVRAGDWPTISMPALDDGLSGDASSTTRRQAA